jgi:hypothetical protein
MKALVERRNLLPYMAMLQEEKALREDFFFTHQLPNWRCWG